MSALRRHFVFAIVMAGLFALAVLALYALDGAK